ncbi:MAG: M36 family metallopeptidase [Saprospiraceae bacterium]|nr:M36 family metallopeptidase [Saprospiraceae bacterium]
MKKLLLLQTVLMLSSPFIPNAITQSSDYLQRAYTYIEETYGLDKASLGDLKIKDQYRSEHNQVEHIHLAQTYKDIELNSSSINLAFLPDGRIYNVGHHLTSLDQIKFSDSKSKVTPETAIRAASASLGISSRSTTSISRYTDKGIPLFAKVDIALQDIQTEQVYLQTSPGEYTLVWKLLIESAQNGHLYQSYVDAVSGKHISNDELTLSCSFENGYLEHEHTCAEDMSIMTTPSIAITGVTSQYRVLPLTVESPNHGSFELVSGAEDPVASPMGWHDTDGIAGAEFTNTRGNNVYAFLDRNYDESPDQEFDGGPDLIFDYPYDANAEPVDNTGVSVTNLFFWNNIMHDFIYVYGMNEQAGSFQNFNYSGQGAAGDFVNAQAQYGADNPALCGNATGAAADCINNAFFNPVPDGFNGRMVMYVWNQDNASKYLDVLEPTELAGKIQTGLATFGPDLTTTPITAEVVIIDDGTSDGSQGCEPSNQPEMEGKIALIDRGGCDFSLKVYYAQEAGAVGVIVANFEDIILGMGPGELAEEVTIPAVLITKQEADRIRAFAGSGLVVSLVAPVTTGAAFRDGALDNSIITHEYTHGISNRLTGGPSSVGCLSPTFDHPNQEAQGMGEGWSDYVALILTARPGDTGPKRRGIGTFAQREETNGKGIRDYPYSTDLTVNPLTYNSIQTQPGEHGIGTVWCAMLWDLYWALSDEYGWDPDVYHGNGGNNTAIQLVVDGMKLQPCNPGFIDARDAILAADMINNAGANQCLIWSVFARRGLGFNANGGDPDLQADGDEGFDLPIFCRSDVVFSKEMSPEVIAGQTITVTLKVTNYKDETLTNVFVEDPLPAGCTYLTGSGNIEPAIGNSLVWSIPTMEPDEELTITYLLQTDPDNHSVRQEYDDIEGDAYLRWYIDFDADKETSNIWSQEDGIVNSGEGSWYVHDVDVESEHWIYNDQAYTIEGNYPVYRFYQYYNTETGVDGGFLEITTDDGDTWHSLELNIFKRKYPRKLTYNTFVIPNLYAYTGLSSTELKMYPSYIDLRDYIGEAVKIRYRFGTSEENGGDGWYFDDVEIMDAILYNSEACVTSDQTDAICAEAPERGTIVDSEITISTEDDPSAAAFMIMPNPAGDMIQVSMSSLKENDAVVRIYDLTGHLLVSENWNLSTGFNQKRIPVSDFASGMYVMQVKTGDGMRSEKFVKE